MYFLDDCKRLVVDNHCNCVTGEATDSDMGIESKQFVAPKCEGEDYMSKVQSFVSLEVAWLGIKATSSIDKGEAELYVVPFAIKRKAEDKPAM